MSVRSTGCPGTGRRNLARRGGAAIAATALVAVLVGCGSDDDGKATATTTPATAGAATTASSAPATSPTRGYGWTPTPTSSAGTTGATQPSAQATVTIDNFTFDPANPTFRVGQTVTVVNNDNVAHTWTSTEGGFDTGLIQPGQSGTVTLQKAGTFAFFCTPHKATMTGTVTVQG